MEGLGDGFGRLLGRILEARGDFWEVKLEKKGTKMKKAKREQKESEKGARGGPGGGSGNPPET